VVDRPEGIAATGSGAGVAVAPPVAGPVGLTVTVIDEPLTGHGCWTAMDCVSPGPSANDLLQWTVQLSPVLAGPCVATVKAARSDLHLEQPRLFGVTTRMGKVPTRAPEFHGMQRREGGSCLMQEQGRGLWRR
jgi:hypothetical protein